MNDGTSTRLRCQNSKEIEAVVEELIYYASWNLLVRDAFKVVPLELAMSSFWFVFSVWSSLSEPRLVIFQYDPKSDRATKRCYK